MQLSITITGGKELEARLARLGKDLLNFTREFEKMGPVLIKYLSNEVYASEGSVFGSRWLSLTPSYAAIKAKHYPGHNVLDATGKMRNGYYSTTTANSITILNHQDYAKYHQTGTKNMPQRILFAFNTALTNSIGEIIKQGITDKLNAI